VALPAGLLAGLAATALLMALGWVAATWRRDVSIVDALWGPAIALAGVTYLSTWPDEPSARGLLAVSLAIVWAVRLSAHVLYRNHGKPEDRRYREIRARNEPGFWWKSLYLVFALQAVLAWLVGLPLYAAVASAAPLGLLDALGVLGFAFGLVFEPAADYQLLRFQAGARAQRGVMDRGLWRYSRHPNYFGEFCLWWGFGLIGLAGGGWWALAGPALRTLFLLKFSGVALTEKDIAGRRPDYQAYIRRTSAFLPRSPR